MQKEVLSISCRAQEIVLLQIINCYYVNVCWNMINAFQCVMFYLCLLTLVFIGIVYYSGEPFEGTEIFVNNNNNNNNNYSTITERKCKTFDYNLAELTLVMNTSNETEMEECVNKFSMLRKGKAIKRIMHANGSVENVGCTKYTKRCNETSHYDSKHGIRINTPPCCRQKVIEIFKHLTQELQNLNVSHMLTFGGVIGWVRNRKFIPYDQDLDMIIDDVFWNTTLFYGLLNKLKESYGHTYQFRDNGKKLWILYSADNNNAIDVWGYKIIKKRYGCPMVSIPHKGWPLQPLENIFPAKHVLFENTWTHVPRNPVAYLDSIYGKNEWRKELNCEHIIKGKCAPLIAQIPLHIQHDIRMLVLISVTLILSFLALQQLCKPTGICKNADHLQV